jgi:hypothetical protein
MHHLAPTKVSKAVNTSHFDRVLNIHSGFLICDMNYAVEVIHNGRMHSILMRNGLRDESPAIYHDNARVFVIEGSLLLEVKLNNAHDVDGVNLPYDIRRVVKLPQGVLICHMAGCVMMSDDLQETLWSYEDERITDIVWRDGELRAFYGEHTSILLGPEIGEEVKQTPAKASTTDQEGDAIVLRFPARRGH